ncbi:MAG: LarC family nickel insertion protein, partial [Candidatus Omnitrophica bacterium]|nr:LarC family nickel insertion protein [Candidatus Omnitrophota bacterium]
EVKGSIIKVYADLYEAEKKVHGSGHAHFEQIGEIDSLIDISSACILIDKLNVDRIIYSSVPFGERVAMATTQLLKNKNIRLSKHPYENITPTGVAVITALGIQVNSAMNNEFIIKDAGYGAGSVQMDGFSNMLRVVLAEAKSDFRKDEIIVVQCNVDDMNPQVLGYLMERLYEAGALEVYFENCYTKKSRIGILISVLSKQDTLDKIARIIFKETTTLGIRYFKADRLKLERKEYIFKNSLGKARIKESAGYGCKKIIPEYDDCVKIAKSKNIALKDVLTKFSGGK